MINKKLNFLKAILKLSFNNKLDDINEGYENLRNLVLNYLGVANQDQQKAIEQVKF